MKATFDCSTCFKTKVWNEFVACCLTVQSYKITSDIFSVMVDDYAVVLRTAAAHSLLSLQGLHPMHLCAQQNRSDFHRGARHHLQGAALRTHFGSPPLELR